MTASVMNAISLSMHIDKEENPAGYRHTEAGKDHWPNTEKPAYAGFLRFCYQPLPVFGPCLNHFCNATVADLTIKIK